MKKKSGNFYSTLPAILTVEASIIFPMVIMVIVALLMLSMRMHDRIIVRSDCMNHIYSSLYDGDNISSDISNLTRDIQRHSILKNTSTNYNFSLNYSASSAPLSQFSGSMLTVDAMPVGSISCFFNNKTSTYQNYDAIIKLIKEN